MDPARGPIAALMEGEVFAFGERVVFYKSAHEARSLSPRRASKLEGVPLFEYRCRDCQKRFTFLTGVVSGEGEPRCPACQSQALTKLMSRFSRGRSDDARLDAVADSLESQDFDDPKALRRFAREMGQQMGADAGEDFGDEVEALLAGEGDASDSAGGDDGTIY